MWFAPPSPTFRKFPYPGWFGQGVADGVVGEGEGGKSVAGKSNRKKKDDKKERRKESAGEAKKKWEMKQQSRGMPTEGLNTFRIKKS